MAASPLLQHTHRHSLSSSNQFVPPELESGQMYTRSQHVDFARAQAQFEEAARYKNELEVAKRENEELRQRIRELQGMLKKQSSA